MKYYPKIRLFVEQPLVTAGLVTLEDAQAHYLTHVMRMKEGGTIALFNGKAGEWRGVITHQHKKRVEVRVEEQLKPHQASPDIWLLFAPIKHGRIDYLAQKATELGVSRLIPVLTQHTMVDRVNTDRLRANAIEAAEQSGRLDVPVVDIPQKLPHLLQAWDNTRQVVYGDERGSGTLPQTLCAKLGNVPLAVLIGPEAGFSDEEHKMLQTTPYAHPLHLGERILRADTAAIAALACIMLLYSELR